MQTSSKRNKQVWTSNTNKQTFEEANIENIENIEDANVRDTQVACRTEHFGVGQPILISQKPLHENGDMSRIRTTSTQEKMGLRHAGTQTR